MEAGSRPRTVLVTGAGRNIGKEIATRFAAGGYRVVVNGVTADNVYAVVTEITDQGGDAIAAAGDITDPQALDDVLTQVRSSAGPVDVIVHGAVARVHAPVLKLKHEDWAACLAVSLDGLLHLVQALLPDMQSSNWGRIISLVGLSGERGSERSVALSTAKAGLIGFTKALAREVAHQGITVNAVSPGLIDTSREPAGEDLKGFYESKLAGVPMRRMGTPADVASACLYLASEDAGYITGQVLSVNGGAHM